MGKLDGKREVIVPDGLMCNTLGLTVRPANLQKPKPGSPVRPDDPDYEASLLKHTKSTVPASLDKGSMFCTWKSVNTLPEQTGSMEDLQTLPQMEEYPVTVPYTHATPFADGLRTYKSHAESQHDLVNNLHAGRWEARSFCRQMDLSANNTHEGRWQKRNMMQKLDNTTPWMHEDRWQQRAGTWQKRVPDGIARGAQGQGAGQGCRQDGVWEGFRLPLDNSATAREPPEKAMYRPPTWGRRAREPPAIGGGGSAEAGSPPMTGRPVSVASRSMDRPRSETQERKGWGGTTVLSSFHGPILRPKTPPFQPVTGSFEPSGVSPRITQKPATLHQVSNGVGEVSPAILKMNKNRHPIVATDVTRWHLANPASGVPPLPGNCGDAEWFGLKKTNVHQMDSDVGVEEVIQQIKPDQKTKAAWKAAPNSTNPHNDPFLRDRKYTYRRILLEEKYQQLTGKTPRSTGTM